MIPRAFVVGHPVKHSRSPLIHGHWLKELGLAGSYERVDIAPAALADFLGGLSEHGFVGGNVTIPHKEAAFRLARELTDRAGRLEAVNTLWLQDGLIHGDNTDIVGFLAHLDASLGAGWERGTRRGALVLGAGGAARAIVAGLLDRGLEPILVANRTFARAKELGTLDPARIRAVPWHEVEDRLEGVDLLVNATSLGMAGQPPLQIELGRLPPGAAVADIVYVPLETPLLAAARRGGFRTVDGLGMLLHQAVPGFERWFGIRPAVTPELRSLLAADIGPETPGRP